jgi:hypothetical protein
VTGAGSRRAVRRGDAGLTGCQQSSYSCAVPPQSTQHVPSQPHSSPLATIHDLPLETIGRIIAIAHSAEPAHWEACKERYRFLNATSLVCREWTPFAQEALWLDVSLYGEQIQSFFEAGAGRHATHKLSVTYGSGKDDSVEAILRNVRGVRELELYYCTVSIDWLCGDNFKGRRTRHFPVDADF